MIWRRSSSSPRSSGPRGLDGLVKVLREQHEPGRSVTDVILRNTLGYQFRKDARMEVVRSCEAFIRMYRPHEVREYAVLFRALHKIVPARNLQELGEQLAKVEDRLFGAVGFEKTAEHVVEIESTSAVAIWPSSLQIRLPV